MRKMYELQLELMTKIERWMEKMIVPISIYFSQFNILLVIQDIVRESYVTNHLSET